MQSGQDNIDVEVLLAQQRWMAGLVRSLLKDQDAVDDVVQETWLRALERAPRAEGGIVSLRAWLAQVARRLALRRLESDEARRFREAAVARTEDSCDPEVATERLRMQRELANHVLALNEPYRTALILRYQEGLEIADIAARLGLTEVAVRQRISRAVRQLRGRLDAEHEGDRAAWCAAYALILRTPPNELAAATAAGSGVWIAAVLVPVIAVGVWWFTGRDSEQSTTTASDAAVELDEPGGNEAFALESATGQRSAAPELARATAETSELATQSQVALRGMVADSHGVPVAGALVEALRIDRSAYDLLQPPSEPAHAILARTSTDAEGSFALELADGRLCDLRVTAPGFASEIVPDRGTGERVRVMLARPASLRGRITRESDGSPVADARLRVVRVWLDSSRRSYREELRTSTDADGGYQLEGLAPGRVSLDVVAETDSDSTAVFELAAGDELVRDLQLAPGARVRGRVVDALTRQPIAGASVVAGPAGPEGGRWSGVLSPDVAGRGWKCRRAVVTDLAGRFELTASADFVRSQLVVDATGYAALSSRLPTAVGELAEIELALTRGVAVRGRVLASDAATLAGARVMAVAVVLDGGMRHIDWRASTTGGDGRFELADVDRDLAHVLIVEAEGLGRRLYELPASASNGADLELGSIVVATASRISGVVSDEAGAPVTGAWVELKGHNADALRFVDGEDASAGVLRSALGSRTTHTDDEGRFVFADACAGSWTLRDTAAERGGDLQLALAAGAALDGVRVVRLEQHTIAGVVIDFSGRPLLDACVVLRAEEQGGAHPAMQVTHADGRFQFEGVEHGAHRLFVMPNSIHQEGGDRMVHAVDLRGVVAGAGDIEIVLPPAAVTTGQVTNALGEPLSHVVVFARDASGALLTYEYTDAAGEFVLRLPPGATADLSVDGYPPTEGLRGVRAGSRGASVVVGGG